MNGCRKASRAVALLLVSCVVIVSSIAEQRSTATECATESYAAGSNGSNGSLSSPNYPLAYAEQQTCYYRFLFAPATLHRTLCFSFLKLWLAEADSISFLVNASCFAQYTSAGLVLFSTVGDNNVLVEQSPERLSKRAPFCFTVHSTASFTVLFSSERRSSAAAAAASAAVHAHDSWAFFAKFTVSAPREKRKTHAALASWCPLGESRQVIDHTGSKSSNCVQQLCNAVDSSVFQCEDRKLCIDSRKRCNRIADCEDSSDENGCGWNLQCSFQQGTEMKNQNKKCGSWSWELVMSEETDVGISKEVSHTARSGSLMFRTESNQSYRVLGFSSPSYRQRPQRLCLQFWFQVRGHSQHNQAHLAVVEQTRLSPWSKRVLWMWNTAQSTVGWQMAKAEIAMQMDQSVLLVFMNAHDTTSSTSTSTTFYLDDFSEAFGKCEYEDSAALDCTFERSTCGWSESGSSWLLTTMANANRGTGFPERDHTTSLLAAADPLTEYRSLSGYFMLLSSARLNRNESTTLQSALVTSQVDQAKCLRFWVVCTAPQDRRECAKLVISQRYGEFQAASRDYWLSLPVTSQWHPIAIELNGRVNLPYNILIAYQSTEASEAFELALDDIQLAHTSCHSASTLSNATATNEGVSSENATECRFRCPSSDDVSCLLPNQFCDGVIDCPDGSDEYNCGTVEFPKVIVNVQKRDVVTYTVSLAIVVCGSFIVFVIVSVFWVRTKLRRHRQSRTNRLELPNIHFGDSRESVAQVDADPPPYWSLMRGDSRASNSSNQKQCTALNQDDSDLPPYEVAVNGLQLS